MNDMSSARRRSLEARQSAQQHLQKLRAERLQKRRALLNKTSEATELEDVSSDADELVEHAVDPSADSVESSAESAHLYIDEPDDVIQEQEEEDADEVAISVATVEEEEQFAIDSPAPDETEHLGLLEDQVDSASENPMEEEEIGSDAPENISNLSVEEDAAEDPDEDSELLALPGAGPGLVWMLREAGITTLVELAQADTEELQGKLGVIGRLLDLPYWVQCAHDLSQQNEDE